MSAKNKKNIGKNELLHISAQQEHELSPEQKRFNKRVVEVEKMKKKVEKAKEQFNALKSMLAEEVAPMEEKVMDVQAKIVEQFAYWCDNPKGFKKKDRQLLKELVLEKARELIERGRKDLIPLFDKYSDVPYEELWKEEVSILKEMVQKEAKGSLGVDIDLKEEDFNSLEEFMAALMQQMEEKRDDIDDHYKEQEKKEFEQKTTKQQEKEIKKKEEAKNISKVVKAAYNKLVKRYHPDLVQDEQELEKRNKLMHKITEAYEKNDLFELLRLQMNMEGADTEDLATMPAEQLDYYNKVLKDQLDDLQFEYRTLKKPNPPFEHFEDYMRCRSINGMKKRVGETVDEMEWEIDDLEESLLLMQDQSNTKDLLNMIASDREFQRGMYDIFGEF